MPRLLIVLSSYLMRRADRVHQFLMEKSVGQNRQSCNWEFGHPQVQTFNAESGDLIKSVAAMLKSTVRSRSIGTERFSGMSGIDIDGAFPNGFDRNQNGWH